MARDVAYLQAVNSLIDSLGTEHRIPSHCGEEDEIYDARTGDDLLTRISHGGSGECFTRIVAELRLRTWTTC